jgi:hypothetical protein
MMIVQKQCERLTKFAVASLFPRARRGFEEHPLGILRKFVPMVQDRKTHRFGEVRR